MSKLSLITVIPQPLCWSKISISNLAMYIIEVRLELLKFQSDSFVSKNMNFDVTSIH